MCSCDPPFQEQLHKLRKELTSAVAVASERSSKISDLEQMFKQKMTQVSTIQEYLAEVKIQQA